MCEVIADPGGPRGLRRRSAAARLLGFRVCIPRSAWIFFSFVCCVDSDLCDGLIIRSKESYLVCVCVCVCV
jgi:hypothetical protein